MPVTSTRPKVVRSHPRISATKLGEYLAVAANRRERILRDQKYPSDFITSRYKRATSTIRAALISSPDVPTRLMEKAQTLSAVPTTTMYEQRTRDCCVQAIRQFARLYPTLLMKGVTSALIGATGFQLFIEGVEISVWPTVLLQRIRRDGSVETGAMLLAFRKGAVLSDHSGQAVAELLRQSLQRNGHTGVSAKMCLVIDVFGKKTFSAPTRSQRLSSEIESACREIAGRWPAIAG
jgi:hypothetical protein